VESLGAISATLDQNLDDLFVPYLENSRYIEREVKSLQELYSSLLYKYNGFHVSPIVKNELIRSLNESLREIKCWTGLWTRSSQAQTPLSILSRNSPD